MDHLSVVQDWDAVGATRRVREEPVCVWGGGIPGKTGGEGAELLSEIKMTCLG